MKSNKITVIMKCPRCGKIIANDSIYCEYCGVKVRKKEYSKTTWIVLAIVLGIAIQCLCGYFCYKYFSSSKNITTEIPNDTVIDPEAVAKAEAEKALAEAQKAEAEAKKAEEERKKEEAKAKLAEANAQKAEAEAKKAKVEAEKAKVEAEKTKAEKEVKVEKEVNDWRHISTQNADSTKTTRNTNQVISKNFSIKLNRESTLDDIFCITKEECLKTEWVVDDKKIVNLTKSQTNIGIKGRKPGKTIIIGKKDGKVKYKLHVTTVK